MFGFPVPQPVTDKHGNPVFYWGARGIYTSPKCVLRGYGRKIKEETVSCVLDLLYDRQSASGLDPKTPEWKAFIDWINKTALPQLGAGHA